MLGHHLPCTAWGVCKVNVIRTNGEQSECRENDEIHFVCSYRFEKILGLILTHKPVTRVAAMSLTSFSLVGKTVLVSGASSGLGAHFARVAAGAGARVVLAARRRGK